MSAKTQTAFETATREMAEASIVIEALSYLYPTYDPGPALRCVRKAKDLAGLAHAAKASPELFTGFYYLAAITAAPELKAICARYGEDENEALLTLLALFTEIRPDPIEVIRLKFCERYRTEKRRANVRETTPEIFTPRSTPTRPVLLKSDLAALTTDEQILFWLLYEGYEPAEIATMYGVKQGTARKRIFTLRKKLSNALG